MDRLKLILIGVCVLLALLVVWQFYRMGVINERTADLKTEIALHKSNAQKFVKLSENRHKQNLRLLMDISDLQCEIEEVEKRLKQRETEIKKIRKDVQDNIDSYLVDTNRIKLFTDLIK